jgi:hypothetical protein
MRRAVCFTLVILVALFSGCVGSGPSESERALQTQVAQQATQLAELQEGAGTCCGPCELIAEGELTVYERPHPDAEVFGTMNTGFRVEPEAKTADGWWGFEPGVAQAANVGIFRLRWVHESSPIRLEGCCQCPPEVVGPPPGVCFEMPVEDVDVYAAPDLSSEVVASLTPGDYAAVVGKSDGWAKLDLATGNTGQDTIGWIPAASLNMNGPCENLPELEPQ